jgi:predicted dehydrogenase
MSARIRMGMIGGGTDAFIGAVHRRAALMDGRFDLVAGCLSRDPEIAKASGEAYHLDPARAHTTLDAFLEDESRRDPSERVELISIVTPNHTHHPIAKACLEAGFHVLLEKPMTTTSREARELRDLAAERGLACVVMYTYSGYPMVREARARVRAGELGAIRKVFVEYHQGWLSTKAEDAGVAQAEWRTDPKQAGLGGALGDIGTHAEHLVSFIAGLEIESLCADLTSFVPGRALDDDASVLVRYEGGAKGVLTASQICAGEGNGLSIRIYGERGGLRWRQESPEVLELLPLDAPRQTVVRGGPGTGDAAQAASRIPVGHPEGFIEAFANVYAGAAEHVEGARTGAAGGTMIELTPEATAGARGVRFVELAVESARAGSTWVRWTD